jgi:hypothetical protein
MQPFLTGQGHATLVRALFRPNKQPWAVRLGVAPDVISSKGVTSRKADELQMN